MLHIRSRPHVPYVMCLVELEKRERRSEDWLLHFSCSRSLDAELYSPFRVCDVCVLQTECSHMFIPANAWACVGNVYALWIIIIILLATESSWVKSQQTHSAASTEHSFFVFGVVLDVVVFGLAKASCWWRLETWYIKYPSVWHLSLVSEEKSHAKLGVFFSCRTPICFGCQLSGALVTV